MKTHATIAFWACGTNMNLALLHGQEVAAVIWALWTIFFLLVGWRGEA